MNQVDLAKKLGATKAQVTKWKASGMPIADVGKAKTWLAQNVPNRKRGLKAAGDMEPLGKSERKATAQDISWKGRLDRARQVEWDVSLQLQKAVQGGKVAQIQALQRGHVSAMEAVAAAEKIVRDASLLGGDLINRETVRAWINTWLTPLREALDKLPLAERTNCNPDHPEIAERALNEWRERFLGRCASARKAFDA